MALPHCRVGGVAGFMAISLKLLNFRRINNSVFPCIVRTVYANTHPRDVFCSSEKIAHPDCQPALGSCDTQPISPGSLKREPARRGWFSDMLRIDLTWTPKQEIAWRKATDPVPLQFSLPHHSHVSICSLIRRYRNNEQALGPVISQLPMRQVVQQEPLATNGDANAKSHSIWREGICV